MPRKRSRIRSAPRSLPLAVGLAVLSAVAANVAGETARDRVRSEPIDPVIEEPLRPLLPEGQNILQASPPTPCGPVDLLPAGMMAVLGLRLCGTERRGRHPGRHPRQAERI